MFLECLVNSVYNFIFQFLLMLQFLIVNPYGYRCVMRNLLSGIVRRVNGKGGADTAGLDEVNPNADTESCPLKFTRLLLNKFLVKALGFLYQFFFIGIGNQHQKLIGNYAGECSRFYIFQFFNKKVAVFF